MDGTCIYNCPTFFLFWKSYLSHLYRTAADNKLHFFTISNFNKYSFCEPCPYIRTSLLNAAERFLRAADRQRMFLVKGSVQDIIEFGGLGLCIMVWLWLLIWPGLRGMPTVGVRDSNMFWASVSLASAVWDPHTHYNTQTLEMVQRRAARYGTTPAASPECSASWSGSLMYRVAHAPVVDPWTPWLTFAQRATRRVPCVKIYSNINITRRLFSFTTHNNSMEPTAFHYHSCSKS